MIKEAIEKILDIAAPKIIDVDACSYTSRPVYPVLEPTPSTIQLHTLTGLVDYIYSNPDGLKSDGMIIHIEDPSKVTLISPSFGGFKQRSSFVECVLTGDVFPWGRYLPVEEFNIKMQSLFVQDGTTAKILSIVGNLKDEKVVSVGDDGTTQQVAARAGIARVENVKLPNPVTLMPYRTFREAEQPESNFVFRMKSGRDGELPTAALFEADGGQWKLAAIQAIRKWFEGSAIGQSIRILA